MAKLLDLKTPARMDVGDGVAYLFRTPTVADAAVYEREVAAAGGRRWSVAQLWGAVEAGLEAIGEHGDVAAAADHVRASRARLAELGAELNVADGEARAEAMRELMDLLSDVRTEEIAEAVAAVYPRYARMLGDNMVYQQVRGQVAARLFLVGWEGVDGEVRRGLSGAGEATLAAIPQARFPDIAAFVEGMLAPSEADRKNS